MKNNWIFFIFGLLLVAGGSLFFPTLRAQTDDARVNTIGSAETSGLRNTVPNTAELEDKLKEREQQITEKEKQLAEVADRLKVEEQRLKLRIEELDRANAEAASSRAKNIERKDAITKRLLKTFEGMQPKKAAGVMSTLSEDLAVDLLLGMKEKKVSAILDTMEANQASALATALAARRPAQAASSEREESAQ
jgi:flagellar motility protein MotE (MotC chaperone)